MHLKKASNICEISTLDLTGTAWWLFFKNFETFLQNLNFNNEKFDPESSQQTIETPNKRPKDCICLSDSQK